VAGLLAARARSKAGSDAFVLNLGSLRSGLPQIVNWEALVNAAPFDAELVVLCGDHSLGDILDQARRLGEEPVVSSAMCRSRHHRHHAIPGRALGTPRVPA
jgi:hypothetical protein